MLYADVVLQRRYHDSHIQLHIEVQGILGLVDARAYEIILKGHLNIGERNPLQGKEGPQLDKILAPTRLVIGIFK